MKINSLNKDRLKKLKYIAISIIAITLVVSMLVPVFGDAGNTNRYDTSSDSDYGSSSTSSGDLGIILWLVHIFFDVLGPIPSLIIIGIVICIWMANNKKAGERSDPDSQVINSVRSNYQENAVEKIKEIDPNFSEEKFTSWAKEVFITIQKAWTDRDFKAIRPFESNELFSMHSKQLDEFIKNNKINVVEKVAVTYTHINSFRVDGDKEILVLELHAVMRDYVIDATTKKVLESDPTKDWNMKYNLTFIRKAGVKTHKSTSNKSTTNCPNCGAPTEITSAGQCGYCGSIITTGEHDFVLSSLESFK
ncbi:MAG: Tim44-like domain-containing protein [Clostridia bacterium]